MMVGVKLLHGTMEVVRNGIKQKVSTSKSKLSFIIFYMIGEWAIVQGGFCFSICGETDERYNEIIQRTYESLMACPISHTSETM